MSLEEYDSTTPVSVVIPNWNGREHLATCLDSLLAQTLSGIEIIVVDNGSSDDSVEFVRNRYPNRVQILPLSTNLGFSGGINAGIRHARGRYLFLLNNDTEVAADCLAELVKAADFASSSGTFAPKILSYSDRARIDNVGHLLYADGLTRGRGRLEQDVGQYDRPEEILLASGCAMLVRRSLLEDIGLFDEELFAYCDDTEFGLRARLAGWSCRSVPSAVVYHKYSASSADYSPMKAYLVERNHIRVAVKCFPGPLLVVAPFFTILRWAVQAFGALAGRGAAGRFSEQQSRMDLMKILARALSAAARQLPSAWRARREIQMRRRVGWTEVASWCFTYGMGVREIALKD